MHYVVGEATAGQGQSAGEDRKAEGSCPPDNVAGRNGPHESSSPAGAGSKSPTDEFISTDEKHSKRPHPSLTATGDLQIHLCFYNVSLNADSHRGKQVLM